MYYLRARYYRPEIGRFWTVDTFESFQSDPMSLHRYVACQNNPVNRIDPSGHTDFIQLLSATTIGARIIAMGGPAIAAASKAAPTIVRGTARAAQVAQRVVASGGDIVAWEQRVMRATQTGMEVIGRFKLDMVVRLPGKTVNTLIESKSAPWDMYFRNPSGWKNFLDALEKQANAFGQAVQSAGGVSIGERVIFFTTKAPAGAEEAVASILARIGANYQTVLWGEQMLDDFLVK